MENQRVRLTKRLLREALISLLQTKSIDRVSVKELCEKAGLNRSTFYLHYPDPYALLKEIEDEVIRQTQTHLAFVNADLSTKQFIAAFLQFIRGNDALFRTLLCQPSREAFQRRFVTESLLSVQQGIVFDTEEPRRKYVYAFLLNGSLSIIRAWVEAGYDLTDQQMADVIFHLSDKALMAYR